MAVTTVHYLKVIDITDLVIIKFIKDKDIRVESWFTQVDDELEAISMDFGVLPEMINVPINTRIKQWAVNFYNFIVCRDNLYATSDTIDQDKYTKKYEQLRIENEYFKERITRDMFLYPDIALLQVNRLGGAGIIARG
jgi:hypothetical protein